MNFIDFNLCCIELGDVDMAFSWGSGSDGQLGLGNNDDYSIPMKLDVDFKINKIIGGGSHTVAVRNIYSLSF